ncbi:hypothetical protein HZB06_02535 [Candidatus Wolfebacteria bacterium]|nr:hypothetical protein [Candidatus Wolfebacteria bacterium]
MTFGLAPRLNFSKEKLWRALSFFGLNEYNLPIAETLAGKDFSGYYVNNAWDSYKLNNQ